MRENDAGNIELLRSTNEALGLRCSQLERETEIVAWYIEVMEDGMDTRSVIQDYIKAKETISKMKEDQLKFE